MDDNLFDDWSTSLFDFDTSYWQDYYTHPELDWGGFDFDDGMDDFIEEEMDDPFEHAAKKKSHLPKNSPHPKPAIDNSPPIIGHQFLLIDLDGTLVDTADPSFKIFKEGNTPPNFSKIKPFPDATHFIQTCQEAGYDIIIVSDSHPQYVKKVVNKLFGPLPYIFLADKPNPDKTLAFFAKHLCHITPDNAVLIGDSWLDIELGRALGIPTILTAFYQLSKLDPLEGLGNYQKNINSGPTYFAYSYRHIQQILKQRNASLPSLEAYFYDQTLSHHAINLKHSQFQADYNPNGELTAFRALARQLRGQTDAYDCSSKYAEFLNSNTSKSITETLSIPIADYLQHVIQKSKIHWDYLIHVPDKPYTQPTQKMKNLAQAVIQKLAEQGLVLESPALLTWNEGLTSSVRQISKRNERYAFVETHLCLTQSGLAHKNIIILDDQFTTGATATTIVKKLREKQAGHILFIALWHYASCVPESKICPECKKPMKFKVRKKDGKKFFSCQPPKYKGKGCGYAENIR